MGPRSAVETQFRFGVLNIPATKTAKEIFELIGEDLLAIEREFGRDTVSGVAAITEIGEYLRNGGDKRLRPALLLLTAKMMDYRGEGTVHLGAVVEIIHTATLVHDDIIDDATIRRGRPSANTKWGNSKCVLAGDWLYMQAFKVALAERNFAVLDTLIELTKKMVEGELLQMEKLGRCISMPEHFDLIERKTACLFSVCMKLGGILGKATPAQLERLSHYGHSVGMAFQIVDDVLDLTASEQVLGKPVGSDLREGKVTMAVIHALERCTPAERATIETVMREGAFVSVQHADVIRILEKYDSLEAALRHASNFSLQAQDALRGFPDSEYKRALQWAAEFVVEREK